MKTILHGISYEWLTKITGGPMGEVKCYLPASDIPLLRQIK